MYKQTYKNNKTRFEGEKAKEAWDLKELASLTRPLLVSNVGDFHGQ